MILPSLYVHGIAIDLLKQVRAAGTDLEAFDSTTCIIFWRLLYLSVAFNLLSIHQDGRFAVIGWQLQAVPFLCSRHTSHCYIAAIEGIGREEMRFYTSLHSKPRTDKASSQLATHSARTCSDHRFNCSLLLVLLLLFIAQQCLAGF